MSNPLDELKLGQNPPLSTPYDRAIQHDIFMQQISNVEADSLDEIAPDSGTNTNGESVAPDVTANVTATEPTETGFTGWFRSSAGKLFNGIKYNAGCVLNGILGFGFNNQGQGLFGAGAGILDVLGISLVIDTVSFNDRVSYKFTNADGSVIYSGFYGLNASGFSSAQIKVQPVAGLHSSASMYAEAPAGKNATITLTTEEDGIQNARIFIQSLSGGQSTIRIGGNGNDVDTRIEGVSDDNCVYVDASADKVGFGTSTPAEKVDVTGNIATYGTNIGTGWFEVPDTWAYASASTITVPTDATTKYQKGDYLRWKQGGGYKYGTIASLTATVITIIVNTDYTVANSAITNVAYSRAVNPLGWPGWFNWAPTPTGFSVVPTTTMYKYSTRGNEITAVVRQGTPGTSNLTTFTIPAPVAAATVTNGSWQATTGVTSDNGVALAVPALVQIASAATAFTLSKDISGTAWTNANGKRANFTIIYEF